MDGHYSIHVFGPRSTSSLSVTSTGSGTVISTSEVPNSSTFTNSPSPLPPADDSSCGRRGNGSSNKGTTERVGGEYGECRNIFCIARGRFSTCRITAPSSVSVSAPSESNTTASQVVPLRDVLWLQKRERSYILVDRECQASTESGGNTVFGGANCDRGAR